MTKDAAYKKVEELITRFSEQIVSYKKSEYNETQTRRDFIDPFFKALGWDVDNEQGNAEAYREVIHEDRVKVGKATKAPDYSFRLPGGKRLFFVEAKKPSVFIKDEILPAYQVRRYGWSAKLAISIITDFEELAIYDCSKKPLPTDKAAVARIKYLNYNDYLTEFDFLWETFSKEKVLRGSFDKFIQGTANKKGTTTVDKEFLLTLDNCRTSLAENIAKLNPALDEDEINFAVQQTIDRIIFLRIAEDRSIEPYGKLQESLKFGNYYTNLFGIFKIADDKYNSGLFNFKKDSISQNLQIDNKVVKSIINQFYYPECPYEFSVLSVEILGSAYEQFLGKTITINKNHKAVIELKPEVRKAGGVYYTPEYIVNYIVENTVGKLTQNKTPKQVAELKIVDPACGSGSFLIGAYQYLLNWHSTYYQQNAAQAKKDKAFTPTGSLATGIKKQILLNNIFGVDIDVNAVEVTKLSLLLKCMEGETQSSIANQASLFNERVLPTLDHNIKSGNSLIDTDYYDTELDFGDEKKIKPFSWKNTFADILNFKKTSINQDLKFQFDKVLKLQKDSEDLINKFKVNEPETVYGKVGGFDIVIGNPPYGALLLKSELDYFKLNYTTAVLRCESYLLFIEKALKLLKPHGCLGLIIPDTLLNLEFTQPTRELLLRYSKIEEIVGLPSNVFVGATVDTIILLSEKLEYNNKFHSSNVVIKTFGKKQNISTIQNPEKVFFVNTKEWFEQNAFNLKTGEKERNLVNKIDLNKTLILDFAEIYSGIKTYEVGKGLPAQTEEVRDTKPFTSLIKKNQSWMPFYDGKHIGRYQLLWNENNWIKYGKWLAAPRNAENFEGEKILIRKITGKTLIASYVNETSYCNTLLFVLKLTNTKYTYLSVLGILNSSLIGWYFKTKFQISDDDTFPQIMIRDILQFRIPTITIEADATLNKLVAQLLQLNKDLQATTLSTKNEQLKIKINYCEDKINELVYQLYNFTRAEIEIIKSNI